jgi:hypothetical protein
VWSRLIVVAICHFSQNSTLANRTFIFLFTKKKEKEKNPTTHKLLKDFVKKLLDKSNSPPLEKRPQQ